MRRNFRLTGTEEQVIKKQLRANHTSIEAKLVMKEAEGKTPKPAPGCDEE